MLIDRGLLIKFIAIEFNQNNISINSYVKIVKLFNLNIQLLNHQNNIQIYFITEASYYKYFKVSKTILFAIFGIIDLKL